jgi:anti-sigma factor RsiW
LNPLPISEEDLHGFVDGELPPVRREAVRAHLSSCPADAARAEALRRLRDDLRAAFADVLAEPSPFSCLRQSPGGHGDIPLPTFGVGFEASLDHSYRWRSVGLCIAFLAGIAAALAGAEVARRFDSMSQLRPGSEAHGRIGRSGDEPLLDRTLRRLVTFEADRDGAGTEPSGFGDLLVVPNLSEAGLEFRGFRTPSGSPNSALCLIYKTTSDLEVTLCVDTIRDARSQDVPKPSSGSGASLSWRQKGFRYSLAGPLDDRELGLLADRTRAEVDKFTAR